MVQLNFRFVEMISMVHELNHPMNDELESFPKFYENFYEPHKTLSRPFSKD